MNWKFAAGSILSAATLMPIGLGQKADDIPLRDWAVPLMWRAPADLAEYRRGEEVASLACATRESGEVEYGGELDQRGGDGAP